jgi:hypothetical protein
MIIREQKAVRIIKGVAVVKVGQVIIKLMRVHQAIQEDRYQARNLNTTNYTLKLKLSKIELLSQYFI